MKVFLDVGANRGESARAALDEKYGFDKIFCFEPELTCLPYIKALDDPRIVIQPFGLGNETKKVTLYGVGGGATVFKDKTTGNFDVSNVIELVRASDWVKDNIKLDDIVFMKLNCEGSECDIIDNLIETEEIRKIYSLMVDFDVRKIPSLRYRESHTRNKIKQQKIDNICFSENVMLGESHNLRIHNWLDLFGAFEVLSLRKLKSKYRKILFDYSLKKPNFLRTKILLKNFLGNSMFYHILKYFKKNIDTLGSTSSSILVSDDVFTDKNIQGEKFVTIHDGIYVRKYEDISSVKRSIGYGKKIETTGSVATINIRGKSLTFYEFHFVNDTNFNKSKTYFICSETITREL